MNTVKVSKRDAIETIEKFFEKENQRVAKEHHNFLVEQSSKRRFFGLLSPKEVDWDFTPTIEHSMAFQHMWPHHEARDVLEVVKAATNPKAVFTVDVRLWAEIKRGAK